MSIAKQFFRNEIFEKIIAIVFSEYRAENYDFFHSKIFMKMN